MNEESEAKKAFEKIYNMMRDTGSADRFDKTILSGLIAQAFEWHKWREEIPFLEFPSHWQVKVVPPFAGAVARFLVRTKKMKEEDRISVYLDCYDTLGFYGSPYWEVYPVNGDTKRLSMNDTESLLTSISEAIHCLEKD